jgi:hypothetical protein
MSITIEYPFTTPGNYTYDTSKIEITGGVGKLKLGDNSNQTFTEDFATDTGFTYDNTKTTISGNLNQIDQSPTNAISWATYTTDEDLSGYGGSKTGTLTGGTISGGFLALTGGSSTKYIDYSATSNFDSQQIFTVKFIVKPNYTGSPATVQRFYLATKADTDSTNQITIFQKTTGAIRININDSSDVNQFGADIGTWSPTTAQEYEFELNCDISTTTPSNSEIRLFIDGNQLGSTGTSFTCTRDSNIGLARIGEANTVTTDYSNFSIKDVVFFSTVQHTTNYTPGYTLPEAKYLGDIITLPAFTYSGAGTIQGFTNFTVTDANTPKYTIDSKWYSGGWTTSNNTYSQANTEAEILANIATLPATDTPTTRLITDDSNVQMTADDLILTYTGQSYPTTDPTILINGNIRLDALEGFTETSTKTGSDEIKYVLKKGDDFYYWSGSAWVISNETYAQSNTAAEIETNKATFTTLGTVMQVMIFLHSNDGSTTPEIDLLSIDYNFFGDDSSVIDKTIVWAYSFNDDGTVNTDRVKATLSVNTVQYKENVTILKKDVFAVPDITGYWEMELVETDNMVDSPPYTFLIDGQDYNRNVPDQLSVNFWDLT